MRKSFLLHIDSLCILEDLSDEQKGQLFNAIYKFQLGEEIKLSPIIKIAFSQFKNQFMRDEEKYKSTCEARKKAGSKGGKQRVANQANATNSKQDLANQAENKNKSDNKNKKDSDNKKEEKEHIPLKESKDEFEPIWKDYTLSFLKAQGRAGGTKKTAKANFNKLIKKYSLSQILDLVESQKKLKLGIKDLERILREDYMKQFIEDDMSTSTSGLVPKDLVDLTFTYDENKYRFTESSYFNLTKDFEITNTQNIKDMVKRIQDARS